MSSPVQYFPCQPIVPTTDNGETYALGRAFLQGAFVAFNVNTNVGWLAQAPGPGDSNSGLGSSAGKDIAVDATDLEVYAGTQINYFAQSWSKHWTPLPSTPDTPSGSKTPEMPSGSNSTHIQSSQGLSTGTIAGIAVGGGVVLVVLAGGMVLCMMKKRKHKANVDGIPLTTHRDSFKTDEDVSTDSPSRILTPPPPFTSRPVNWNPQPVAEMPGDREVQELPWESRSRPVMTQERSDPHELGLPATPRPQ